MSAETAQLSPGDGDTLQLEQGPQLWGAGVGMGGVLASRSESRLAYNKMGLGAQRMEPKREGNRGQSSLPTSQVSLSMVREISHLLFQTMVSDSHIALSTGSQDTKIPPMF